MASALPGMRPDTQTPGGMPTVESQNAGGALPSVPQNRNQNMGPGVQGPDPGQVEELFNQYTAGQITREDLINALHTVSEGQGGILGLLEGMQGQSNQSPGVQPSAMPQQGGAQPAAPNPVIPPHEPLDARHQKISTLLQSYGLGPADADQMSTILNPREEGEGGYYSQEEGLWVDAQGGIGYDPTVKAYGDAKGGEGLSGSQASLHRMKAGLGTAQGSRGAGFHGGKAIGDKDLLSDEDLKMGSAARMESLRKPTEIVAAREVAALPEPTYNTDLYGQSFEEDGSSDYSPPSRGIYERDGKYYTAGGQEIVKTDRIDVSAKPNPSVVPTAAVTPAPVKPIIETKEVSKYKTEDYHPATVNMPEGWGKTDRKKGDYWEKEYQDPSGKVWPTEAAYRMVEAAKTKQFQGERPVVWTKDGMQEAVFLGWDPDTKVSSLGDIISGGPIFGAPGGGTPFGVRLPESEGGNVYFFDTHEDMVAFRDVEPGMDRLLPNGDRLPRGTNPKDLKLKEEKKEKETVYTADNLPPGWTLVDDGTGVAAPVNTETGQSGTVTEDGNFLLPEPISTAAESGQTAVGTTPAAQAAPTRQALNLNTRAFHEAPMLRDFASQITTESYMGIIDNTELSKSMIDALSELDQMKMKGDQASAIQMSQVIQDQLDRSAMETRANLDREFQENVAIGEIAGSATIAKLAEQNQHAWKIAQESGYMPVWDEKIQSWNINATPENRIDTLASRTLNVTEASKLREYETGLMSLFGQYVAPDADVNTTLRTIEAENFGLTKALKIAETTGKIPDDWRSPEGFTNVDTFAMKRFAFEKDMAKRNADLQDRHAKNTEHRNYIDMQISANRDQTNMSIANGQLAEAIEARKDATWLASEKLKAEKDMMRIDTLLALSDPATFLFATRFGLLDNIGDALGIDFGDDTIDLPSMTSGEVPTLTDFQNASESQRQIILAEMASSGGYTTDEAVRRIVESAPGGRDVRRPAFLGVSR